MPDLPGPKGHPFLGNAIRLSREALEFLRECASEYGDVVGLRFAHTAEHVAHAELTRSLVAPEHRG